MKRIFIFSIIWLAALAATGCSYKEAHSPMPISDMLIINEGAYGSANSSICRYDKSSKKIELDLYEKINDTPMGDSPTQAIAYGSWLCITMSGSGYINIVNPSNLELQNRITGLNSPRYINFLSNQKAYITNLNRATITIVDPRLWSVVDSISLHSPAEQMILHNGYIYANQWSYGRNIIKIDPKTDTVTDSIDVGVQPSCLIMDRNNNFWTLCDGGWAGNPAGDQAPEIVRVINLSDKMVAADRFVLNRTTTFAYKMTINSDRNKIYYIAGDKIFAFNITDTSLPTTPIATIEGATLYAISIDPINEDIYVSDAGNYTQAGTVYRLDRDGKQIDKFKAGIIPSLFVF